MKKMLKRTNIVLDARKLRQAKGLTKLKTTREIVDYALARLTRTTKVLKGFSDLSGKVDIDPDYDYKRFR